MLKKAFAYIENKEVSISQWTIGFVCIMFVRFILESLSSPTPSGIIPSDPYTLVHYGLFFLSAALVFICVIGFFTKNYSSAGKIVLFIWPLVWLAPILDIVISKGNGYVMSYIYDTNTSLFLNLFKVISLEKMHGATYGMRVEIIIILLLIGYYVYDKTKKIKHSFLSAIIAGILLFLLGSTPSVLYTLTHIGQSEGSMPANVIYYVDYLINNSNIYHNTLHEGTASVSPVRFLQLGLNKLMSQILFIISIILGSVWLYKINPNKFKTIIKNSRPERVAFWLTLLLIGVLFAFGSGHGKISSWVDIMSLVCLCLAWSSLWIYSVHINDIYDLEIDRITNSNRPLVKKQVTEEEMREISNIWLAAGLIGAWAVGFYPFFMSLVCISASYIYSAEPLRLKKFPLISTFIIGVVCLSTVLSGFFFLSIDKQIYTFPILASIGIIIIFTLESNFKDMKDIEGDKQNGVMTLPVVFGEKGPMVVGICFALSFLLTPIFFSFYTLYIIAIPCSIVGYYLINKKPYKERGLFIIHFIFILGMVILVSGLYIIGKYI